jgi:hypothetical protein
MLATDEQQLRQMLDVNILPPEIVQEYSKRRALRNHVSAGSGPMSADGLVDLIRACGLEAKETLPLTKDEVRWGALAPGTPISVQWNNELRKAKFHRFATGGVVHFFLDGDKNVRTAPRINCDLWREPEPEPIAVPVSVFHQGQWVDGDLKRKRNNGDFEVAIPGDEKAFRIFTAEHVKEPELVA